MNDEIKAGFSFIVALRLFLFSLLLALLVSPRVAAQQKPEVYLQSIHTGGVYSMTFGADGRSLITSGGENAVKVWDLLTGRDVRTLQAQQFGRGATSRDGKILASMVGDSITTTTIKLWEIETGRELRTLVSPEGELDSLALSPNGELIAACHRADDKDGPSKIIIWNVTDGTLQRTLAVTGFLREIRFSPDNKHLLAEVSDLTEKKQQLFRARVWDIGSGQEVYGVTGGFHYFYSPEGSMLADSETSAVTIWNAATGAVINTLKDPAAQNIRPVIFLKEVAEGSEAERAGLKSGDRLISIDDRSFTTPEAYTSYFAARKEYVLRVVRQSVEQTLRFVKTQDALGFKIASYLPEFKVTEVAFSPDGRTLATACSDETVKFWDVTKGTLRRQLNGSAGEVRSLAFSPDGLLLATGNQQGEVFLWDADSGRQLRKLSRPDDLGNHVATIVFSRDGQSVAAGWGWSSSGSFKVWNVATGQQLELFSTRLNPAVSVDFTDNGGLLTISEGPSVSFWNMMTGTMLPGIKQGYDSWTISPDSKTLITVNEKKLFEFWEIGTGARLRAFPALAEVGVLSLSPDGKILVSRNAGINGDGHIRLWDAPSGVELRTSIKGDYSLASEVVFSPNSSILAVPYASYVELWSLPAGRKLGTTAAHDITGGDAVLTAAFSPDGKTLATAGTLVDGQIKLWNPATGRLLRTLTTQAGETTTLAFSPDGKLLASVADGLNVKLWDAATGRLLRTVEGGSVSFSRDGKIIASSVDRKTKFWDAASGEELASLIFQDQNTWLVVTPDGLFDGSPDGWKSILWRFSESLYDVAPVEIFFNEFYYPNLLADLMAGKRPRARADISQLDRRQPRLHLSLVGEHSTAKPIGERNVTVKVEVTDAGAGAQDVRLFRNGSLVKVWSGTLALDSQGHAELTASLPIVAGENLLTAYGFNRDNIKSADAALKLTGAQSLKRQGTAYIMVVGINSYVNPDFALRYAVADARAFAAELSAQQNRLRRYERTEVIALYNSQATRAGIMHALSDLASRTQPEDAVVIYFAGHGTAQASRFYLIPHDLGYMGSRTEVTAEGLKTLIEHSISDRELETAFEQINAGQLLLVIDACNSGQALEAEEKRRGPMNSKGLAQLAYEKGMSILTAAQGYQEALENEYLGHGYLTYALIEDGLKKLKADIAPKDHLVTEREWLDYATRRVPQMQEQEGPPSRKGPSRRGVAASSNVQRPRVFYRRETETQPLIVAQ
jgi:WD40 repeat protein